MRIRRANPSDIPAMMSLERENPAAPHWPRQQYADLFQKNSERSEHCAWLLEVAAEGQPVAPDTDSPKIIAFLVARRVDVEWELENIVVAATLRRRGLGGLLLRELISHAQAAAGKNVFLEVRQSNRRARAFYQKFGFVETGVRKNYYPTHDSMAAEDAVLCRLSIA